MTKTEIKITKLTAAQGQVLTNGEAYGKQVYLGVYDCPDNWREISQEEYEKIMEETDYV